MNRSREACGKFLKSNELEFPSITETATHSSFSSSFSSNNMSQHEENLVRSLKDYLHLPTQPHHHALCSNLMYHVWILNLAAFAYFS